MDLGGWLRSLGLEKYEAVLRDNEIDETVLPKLTEDHLRELGFPLGARLKLLSAIAALDAIHPTRTTATIADTPARSGVAATAAPTPEAVGERRQVTVMFSDLVGSTALAGRMDPEDLREVISAYQKCVAETVRRFGGFVAKYMGDGVLVYFGYPQAHEDDAERAVRAGLELIAAVSALKVPVSLQTRVGIATGLVVVGDLIGSGEAQERGIVGETPNLAARLQGIAEPNTVVIAESTRRLLGNLFELEDLGAKDLKGIAEPVRTWAALRASSQDIIERTDGIPLFVEEITKAVLEAGSEGAAQQTAAAIPSPALAVPASLQASLMARLDRLGPARGVAQLGAAIGREFSHALLATVATEPEPQLASALDRLIGAGLLFRQGVLPHASYLFKHALVQDAAYGTLLRERRRTLHARIAQALESYFPEIADSQPELLARHYTEAGLIEKAAYLWGKAGQRSLERSSLVEAIEQLTRALAQIATLPTSQALRQEEIKLQVALVPPLLNVKGFAAAETKAATERARSLIEHAEALGEPLKDPLLLFSVLFGGWVANFVAFNGAVLRKLAAQFLALAESQGATAPLMVGHSIMGVACATAGKFLRARAHYDQALLLYDPSVHRALLTRFAAQDQRVVDLSFRSLTLWMLGYPDTALADAERALQEAREIDHASTLMFALWWTGLTKASCGSYTVANALAEELVALADQNSSPTHKVTGTVLQGIVLALTNKSADAIEIITGGLSANRSMGTTLFEPFLLSSLAFAHSKLGQSSEALRYIEEAMTVIQKGEECWYEAEVNRVAGEIALTLPEPDTAKAQEFFERALAIARSQQAKSWELCSAMSMARLWRDQGKRLEARDLLAPIYSWFTEGLSTPVLQSASGLLENLG